VSYSGLSGLSLGGIGAGVVPESALDPSTPQGREAIRRRIRQLSSGGGGPRSRTAARQEIERLRQLLASAPPPRVGFGEQAGVTFEDFAAGRYGDIPLPEPLEVRLPSRGGGGGGGGGGFTGIQDVGAGKIGVPPDTIVTLPNGAQVAAGVLVMGGATQTLGQLTGDTTSPRAGLVLVDPDTIVNLPNGAQVSAGLLAASIANQRAQEYAASAQERAAERRKAAERERERTEALLSGEGAGAAERDAFAQVQDVLRTYGLGGLDRWVWSMIVNGRQPAEILRELRQTEVYKARFPAMDILRSKGLPLPTEAEYLAYEARVRELFRQAGMPREFYDQPADIAFLMGNNLSVAQVADRLDRAFVAVRQAPEPVRQAFAELFGPDSERALAAYVFDPDRALPVLERAVATAEVRGAAATFGFDVGATRAAEIAATGARFGEASAGFARIAEQAPLYTETIGETTDLRPTEEGAAAAFGLPGAAEASRALQRRLEERRAAFAGGGQFAALSGGYAVGEAT
jgi:hypothetical protein